MFRTIISLLFSCLVLLSCKTAPASGNSVSELSGLERFGAGGMEEDGSDPELAATPGAMKKLKASDVLAQASIHETDMDAALVAGDFQAALVAHDQASLLLSRIPAGAERLRTIRLKMDGALDVLLLEAVSGPPATVAGVAFKGPFSARASIVESGVKRPASSLPCVAGYPAEGEDGTAFIATESLATDATGLVAFTAPVPAKSGKRTLTLSVALNSSDPYMQESLRARREKGQLSVGFTHLTASSARRIPTTISILDFNQSGKPLGSYNISATTLLKPLVQRGFSRIGMADFPKQLESGDEEALIKAAKAQFGNGVQRFIYGTVRVESLTQDTDQQWTCTLLSNLSVWDFTLGQKVLSREIRHSETRKTEAASIDAARKKLAGELLVDELVYGL